jgi:hypothetical protein
MTAELTAVPVVTSAHEADARDPWRRVAAAALLLTTAQLAVATFATGLPQFEGKAFGARLASYPCLMLLVPVIWAGVRHRRGGTRPLPWAGFAFLMFPFLVDVTGNTADLYDQLWWWDDLNHYVNWLLLCIGVGLLLERGDLRPAWALASLVSGLGAILAIAWELGEWYTFIRHGTELASAYEDTLGDLALGTLGGVTAGVALAVRARKARPVA